jgi:hypothetical protein
MRVPLRLLVLPVVVAMLFAGCGGDDDDAATATTNDDSESTTTVASEPVLEGAELQSVLLDASDMPEGWRTKPAEDDDDNPRDDELCNLEPPPIPDDDEDTQVAFETGAEGIPTLFQLAASEPAAEITEKFELLEAAFAECVGESWDYTDDEGDTVTYSLADLDFPELGDDSFAFAMTGQTQVGPVDIQFVAIQRETVVTLLLGGGADLPQYGLAPLPEGLLEQSARRAVEKINEALELA